MNDNKWVLRFSSEKGRKVREMDVFRLESLGNERQEVRLRKKTKGEAGLSRT